MNSPGCVRLVACGRSRGPQRSGKAARNHGSAVLARLSIILALLLIKLTCEVKSTSDLFSGFLRKSLKIELIDHEVPRTCNGLSRPCAPFEKEGPRGNSVKRTNENGRPINLFTELLVHSVLYFLERVTRFRMQDTRPPSSSAVHPVRAENAQLEKLIVARSDIDRRFVMTFSQNEPCDRGFNT